MTKNVLVLGGASDIGRAIITEFHPDYDVVSTYFNSTDVARTLPGKALRCDIRDLKQIDYVFEQFKDGLDLLITSAFPFLEGDNLDFQGYLEAELFLRGHVYTITKAAKIMTKGGKIFNILGQCVERGLPGGAFYSASFAYLHNLGNSINAKEGKTGKISVCDLLLGPVNTREWNNLSDEVVNRYKEKVVGFIEPKQIAETVRFLAEQTITPSTFKLDAYYGY